MDDTAFEARLKRFRSLMAEKGVDAFLVSVPENRYYLSGYAAEDMQLTESSGYLLISTTTQTLLTDSRYEEEAKAEVPDFDLVIYSQGLSQVLPDLFSTIRPTKVGVEVQHLTVAKYREVKEALAGAVPGAEVVGVDGLAEELRVIKEPEEIERIRRSLALTESALRSVWDVMEPGMVEKDVAWRIEKHIREGGGEAVSFPPIVAGGPNGALPHAVPTERRIREGETLILDLGSKLDHYCSDMTRTWTVGKTDERMKTIYRVVREAQLAAQDSIRAGRLTSDVDAVARNLIADAGYGDCFGHGLGHGVGLAVHEPPGLRKVRGTVLEENMVVTVEPGIYLPGIGGVRLENMVRVTTTGCEVLNAEHLFYQW